MIEVYVLEFGRQIWIFGRGVLSSDKQWVEVISNPMIIAHTDVDSCCLATQPDVGLLLAEHIESTKKSELARLKNNLKKRCRRDIGINTSLENCFRNLTPQ